MAAHRAPVEGGAVGGVGSSRGPRLSWGIVACCRAGGSAGGAVAAEAARRLQVGTPMDEQDAHAVGAEGAHVALVAGLVEGTIAGRGRCAAASDVHDAKSGRLLVEYGIRY